jgi:hypothetical protein
MANIKNIVLCSAGAAVLFAPIAQVSAVPMSRTVIENKAAYDTAQEYGRRHRRHHDDHIDAGDVAAGIGILAGIAIIAGIANDVKKSSRKTRGDSYPEPFPEQSRQSAPDSSYRGGDDVGSAVTLCSDAAERAAGNDARVDEIRSVTRAGSGWQVVGDFSGGARGFNCATANGAIEYVRMNDTRSI